MPKQKKKAAKSKANKPKPIKLNKDAAELIGRLNADVFQAQRARQEACNAMVTVLGIPDMWTLDMEKMEFRPPAKPQP